MGYVFWIDDLEYLLVCTECYHRYKDRQHTGATKMADNSKVKKQANKERVEKEQKGHKCEWTGCDKELSRNGRYYPG